MDRGTLGLIVGLAGILGATAAAVWGESLASPAAWGAGDLAQPPPARAQRIVSATLATDELLLALIEVDRIAALTTLVDDPAVSNAAEAAAAVAGRVKGEAEAILARDPDLVFVAPFLSADAVALIESSGVPVLRLPPFGSLDEIRELVLWTGRSVGAEDDARGLAAQMDATLAEVGRRTAGAERPRVLFYDPSGATAGPGTVFDELLAIAGGVNAAAEWDLTGYANLPIEAALAIDPEVILLSDYSGGSAAGRLGPERELADDPVWQGVAAVRNSRVYSIPGRHLVALNHHVAKAAEDIARALHPERFEP